MAPGDVQDRISTSGLARLELRLGTSYARQTIGYRGSRTASRLPKRSSAHARVVSMAAVSRSAGTFHVQENTRPSASWKNRSGVESLCSHTGGNARNRAPSRPSVSSSNAWSAAVRPTRPVAGPAAVSSRILQLLPETSLGPDVQEQHAAGSNDADELGDGVLPPRDQMQHVAGDRAAEDRVAERQPRRVAAEDREGRTSTGFLRELPQHRRGKVQTRPSRTRIVERKRDQARSHADLEARLASSELDPRSSTVARLASGVMRRVSSYRSAARSNETESLIGPPGGRTRARPPRAPPAGSGRADRTALPPTGARRPQRCPGTPDPRSARSRSTGWRRSRR